jgi:hypothetical protein
MEAPEFLIDDNLQKWQLDTFEFKVPYSLSKQGQVLEWCRNHFGRHVYSVNSDKTSKLYKRVTKNIRWEWNDDFCFFSNADDATLFKLTWGHYENDD